MINDTAMETNNSVNDFISEINETRNYADIPAWTNILGISFMLTVTLVGILGNGIILLVQWKNRDKSSTDYLVLAMAAFELYCSGFNGTLSVLNSFGSIWKRIVSVPICYFQTYSIFLTSISTTFLLTATAIDRYLKTYRPLNTYYTKTRGRMICIALIITSLILATPSIGTETLDKNKLECKRTRDTMLLSTVLELFLAMVFLIMFVIVVVCYTKVTLLLHKRHRQKALSRLNASLPLENSTKRTDPCSSRSRSNENVRFPNNKVCPIQAEDSVQDGRHQSASNEGREKIGTETKYADQVASGVTSIESIVKFANQQQQRERKILHRTTLIMFLITVMYIVTWLIHFTAHWIFSPSTLDGRTALYLTTELYRINCLTNPIFYISMSSKFRENAKRCLFRH